MKVLAQCAVIAGLSAAGALATWRSCGPPQRAVPCDDSLRRPDEVCLAAARQDWGTDVLWVDARPRTDWSKDGYPGSMLYNLDPGEDMNQFEADAAVRSSAVRHVVVYCASESCGTSRQVAERIRALGLCPDVRVLHGGWRAIQAAGLARGGAR